jgi:hypothetical protein
LYLVSSMINSVCEAVLLQGRFLASVEVQSAVRDVTEGFRRLAVGLAAANTDVFQHSIVELHQRAALASHLQSRAEMGDPSHDLTDELRDRMLLLVPARLLDNCGLHSALSFVAQRFFPPALILR